MDRPAVQVELGYDDAIVLLHCVRRLFGEHDLHDWDRVSFSFENECEQHPFFELQQALAGALVNEETSGDFPQILASACRNISVRQWGEEN